MATPSSYVKNATMGTLTLADGTGTPVTLAVSYDRGDLAITGLGPKLNNIGKFEARGRFVSHAYTERRYPTVKFTAWLPNVAGSSATAPGSLAEFVSGLGAYAANTPTAGTGRPYTVKLTWTIEGTNFGDAADETVVCNNVFVTFDLQEAMDGNTISLSGEVLGSVVVTNSTNTVTYAQIT